MSPKLRVLVISLVLPLVAGSTFALAQEEQDSSLPEMPWGSVYELPSESVQELFTRDKNFATLDAKSPDGRYFLLPRTTELSTVENMGRPTQRLAGLELRGQRNRTWRLDTYGVVGASVFDLETGDEHPLQLPDNSFYSDFSWSADGAQIAVVRHGSATTELWMAEVATGHARRLGTIEVQATLATRVAGRTPRMSLMVQTTPNGGVITLAVPADRGPAPERGIAKGPLVRRTRGAAKPNPTYPFLLEDAHEEALFRYYTTSQLTRIDADGSTVPLGEPGMFTRIALSPDGAHILTERIVEPLSPLVSYRSFGTILEVRGPDGAVLATIRERPLQEARSRNANRDLAREVQWLPDGSGLAWLQREADQDEEADDAKAEAATEEAAGEDDSDPVDQVMILAPPFDLDTTTVMIASEDDLSGLGFSTDAEQAFAEVELDGNKRALQRWDLNTANADPVRLAGPWDPEDPLALPGDLMLEYDANGNAAVRIASDGAAVFLQGAGYQDDYRPRPFIDRLPLDGADTVRIFEGASDIHETPLVTLDDDMQRLIIERESQTTFPDSWEWTSGEGFTQQLTDNVDPFPEVTGAARRDFDFTRRDGLTIQSRISMPVGWQDGDAPVPALFWTYPSEYEDNEVYQRDAIRDRIRNTFGHVSYLRWSGIWLTQGYAVVYPDVPIIGDPYNDHYIQDLSDSLYAAIRAVDNMDLVDIDRIGHGGHSYGAFATGNLLANTPYFQAGIAGDGAYNRTLTPMGFQAERRMLWDAQDVYLEMSPLFQADHIDTPLLMYHGGNDNNTGTFPIQSRRLMQALQALDKTAVLYEYPYESHGPRAIESYLDLWKHFLDFFDMYVKNSQPAGSEAEDE
jgi:dipeptidyl aminopeptidase/acylaminoacyl peptidase